MQDCLAFIKRRHGTSWAAKPTRKKGGKGLTSFGRDMEAVCDVLWRAAMAEWFEYPVSSRLHYFRFPERYRNMARDGAPVYFGRPGPTSKNPQRNMPEAAKEVLRKKILDVIGKRYIDLPEEEIESWIQYFAVPKGEKDGDTLDWRVVYDGGANGLNDSVWVPSFWMPTVSSLLRMLDDGAVMQDRDIGEMFLNFMLHPSARRFAGIDLRPLNLSKEECRAAFLCWLRLLMGFRASPYNSI